MKIHGSRLTKAAIVVIGVCAALKDTAYTDVTLATNREHKKCMSEQLRKLGLHPYPSAANFLLLRLPDGIGAAECWRRLIVEYSIVLRECGNFETLLSGHLRCSVRAPGDNAKLVNALRGLLTVMPKSNR